MRTEEFWALVDRARAGGEEPDTIAERLVDELAGRDVEQIAGFERHLRRVLAASHHADLWGAAYLINGGCSDDGFADFRGWLVTQGRTAFAAAVARPDTLADLPAVRLVATSGAELAAPAVLGVAGRAHARATGAPLPAAAEPAHWPDLEQDFWDFDDEQEVGRRFPRLAALFGEPPEQ